MPPQPQNDPFAAFVVQDDPFAAFVAPEAAPEAPPQAHGSGGASATIGALRAVPAAGRGLARFAAKHPAGTQKTIGAGISTVAGGIGAGIGGVPGAVVGASIRGVTPAQSVIRETAGRLAGEAPAVAKNAGRALGVINYAKETPGLMLGTKDLIGTGTPTKALDHYAESMGQKVVRILGPDGKVAIGPEAPKVAAKAGVARTAAGKAAGAVGRILSPLSVMTGATDFAQTVEPTRTDIGVMGLGRSQPTPTPDETAQIDTRNKAAIAARHAEQARQQQQVRAWILSQLGF